MSLKFQVFVSSPFNNLQKELEIVTNSIIDAGHIPIGLENYISSYLFPMETIYKWINQSDVFILVIGTSYYGTIEKESGKSYTQLEYEYALLQDKPILSIVLGKEYFSKKSSYWYNDVNNPLYKNFKSLISSKPTKYIKHESEIQTTIMNVLNIYNILNLVPGENSILKKQEINNFIQSLYEYNLSNFDSLLNIKNINNKLLYYFSIFNNFKIESISNFTANNCIVDPLGNPISDISNIRIDISEINDWMLNELNKNPTDLYKLSSRRFEELIAEILIRKGYKVELTPATRDGGKDIYAAYKNDLGSFLYVVECKKYNSDHKVGVKVLRDLYGVLSKERATYGIAVTTSYFTKQAKEFQQDLHYQMAIQDFNSIKKWLYDVT